MKSALILIFGLLQYYGFNSEPIKNERDHEPYFEVNVKMDISRVLRKVDKRYLSVALDASLASEEKFMSILGFPKLRTLTKALNPAFLRFGGTRQDFMLFNPKRTHMHEYPHEKYFFSTENACKKLELPSLLEERLKKEWAQKEMVLAWEDLQRKYKIFKFTEYTVDVLYSFANCSGLDLIFGLNALLRTAANAWNSSNARSLLQYCESKQYRMSWELGNEPNSYEKKAGIRVDGNQLGKDFTHLRKMLRQSMFYNNSGLYGPDVSQPRIHRKELLDGFLESGSDAIDSCTWHQYSCKKKYVNPLGLRGVLHELVIKCALNFIYYVNGRDASLDDFLNTTILDSLAIKIKDVLEIVDMVSPGKKVWLGETSSAYGGGAIGLSDTFVAGFMWLDKLGLGAKLGLDVVIRQVLIGSGSYHLVDDNLDPLPDYWLSVLYKRLVGPEVLRIEDFSIHGQRKKVRLYLHCTSKRSTAYRNGAVTLLAMNLGSGPARIQLPAQVSVGIVEAFVLQSDQPNKEGLCSRFVKLNGKVLQMVDDKTLPDLKGTLLQPGEHLQLPGFSLAFYVLTGAGALACQ